MFDTTVFPYLPNRVILGATENDVNVAPLTIAGGQGVLQAGAILKLVNNKGTLVAAAGDTVYAVLLEGVDTTAGDVTGSVALSDNFNATYLSVGTGLTVAQFVASARAVNIYIETGTPLPVSS